MAETPQPPAGDQAGSPTPDPTAPPPPPGGAEPTGGVPPSHGAPPPGAGGTQPPPGGYAPPGEYGPPGGYAPPPGYPGGYPPPYGGAYPGYAPPGYASSDEKTWALIAHFGGAAGALVSWGTFGWVAPLIVLLAKGNQSPTVRAHAVSALNFQILWAIISLVAIFLGGCLFWLIVPMLLFLVPLVPIILGIVGGVKANDGQLYRYPLSASLIK